MLQWIKDYIYYTIYSGPARNAPNNGINIKKFIEDKPPDIKLITGDDLVQAKNKLKTNTSQQLKTNSFFTVTTKDLLQAKHQLHKTTNQKNTIKKDSPLLEEFNMVFKMGYKEFFDQRKIKL